MAFKITRGSHHDSKEAVPLLKKLKGLAFGDKGYLGKKIFEELIAGGLKLITRSRKNMKNKPKISRYERLNISKCSTIENDSDLREIMRATKKTTIRRYVQPVSIHNKLWINITSRHLNLGHVPE